MEELYELPEGWTFASLGEVGEYINGRAFKPSEWEDKGLPIIRIQNLTGTSSKFNRCSNEVEDRYYVKNGDLLISWSASLGVFIWDGSDALLNQHIFRVEPNHDLVTKKFLFYASKYVIRELEKKTHGTGMVHVTKGMFEETKIPLPPLNEQHRIVTKLEALLAHVNTSNDHLANVPPLIKRFRQSVLAAACSGRMTEDWRREHPDVEPASELLKRIQEKRIRLYEKECQKAKTEGRKKPKKPKNLEPQEVDITRLPELPEEWVWCKLKDILNGFQPGFACGVRDDRGYVQLRMNNIGLDGKVVLEKTLRVPIERTNQEKYNLRWGDLLFNNTNSVELIGKTALFRDEVQNCVFSNHITRIRPDIRLVNSEYLLNLFIDDYNKGVFRLMCHRFVGQAGISREKLLEHILPLPPSLEQHAVVERVEDLFKFADKVEQCVATATTHANQLTKSLLAKAFRGELVPQDPNGEPATVLLERIKKEKAEQKEMKKAQKRKAKTLLDFN